MIHYHMEKTQPMIKDGEKSPNSRVYLQKLEQNILVQSWQKYFKIPAGLTNTDREGSEKKHAEIRDSVPTSKGEGLITENLKCTKKQAASARAVPETSIVFISTSAPKEGEKRNSGSPPFFGAASPCH